MKKLLYIFGFLLFSNFSFAQELNAQVQVNYQSLGGSNLQLYRTLEKA